MRIHSYFMHYLYRIPPSLSSPLFVSFTSFINFSCFYSHLLKLLLVFLHFEYPLFHGNMANVPAGPHEENYPVPLATVFPHHARGVSVAIEDEEFPMVEEIVPRSGKIRCNFSKKA